MRYFIHLAYNGSRFNGWQIQPNAVTVQATIQEALSILLKDSTNIIGCGRTDTGVHALDFYAHFEHNTVIDCKNIAYRLNNLVGKDIAIKSIFNVNEDLHARFSATSRTYTYTISLEKNPFNQETAFQYYQHLHINLMNQAAKFLFYYNDFTSFSKLHTDVNNNICEIYKAEWVQHESTLIFTISANRFLRNMVRAITGTLLDVGRKKITVNDFEEIIKKENRCAAGVSIAARGLSLVKVMYPEGFDKQKDV